MRKAIIPCELLPETKDRINEYAESLKESAHTIGSHGLPEAEFWDSGLFGAAIERLRGQQAASTTVKYNFVKAILTHLKDVGEIEEYLYSGSGERHDFEIAYSDGYRVAIETKGCLDGNNTNIFLRPPSADEFVIWSLCQNPGADPRHNVWSGVHTRLGAEVIHRRERVDTLVVWDMICGTAGRPCPKLDADPLRAVYLPNGKVVPPPCLYLFPRTIPDARNNPHPRCWMLPELRFASSLSRAFGTAPEEAVSVGIEVRMDGANVERRTTFTVDGASVAQSGWTKLSRAR